MTDDYGQNRGIKGVDEALKRRLQSALSKHRSKSSPGLDVLHGTMMGSPSLFERKTVGDEDSDALTPPESKTPFPKFSMASTGDDLNSTMFGLPAAREDSNVQDDSNFRETEEFDAFNRRELLVVYIMMVMASPIPTSSRSSQADPSQIIADFHQLL